MYPGNPETNSQSKMAEVMPYRSRTGTTVVSSSLEAYRAKRGEDPFLIRLSRLPATLIGNTLRREPTAYKGFGIALGLLAISVALVRSIPQIDYSYGPMYGPKVVSKADLMGMQLRDRHDNLREVMATALTRIIVTVDEGINVRDYPSTETGNIVINGEGEPVGEIKTGEPAEGLIEGFVIERDPDNPTEIRRLWAGRWVPDRSNQKNGGAGRLEYVAVWDRDDGGCFVDFTNPRAAACS